MSNHHPSADRLSCFAAGSLPMNQALCISVHAEHCPQCRRELQRLELLGAELFSAVAVQRRSDNLKTALMAKLDDLGLEADTGSPATEPKPAAPANVPRSLRKLLPDGLQGVHWKRLSPAIYAAKLCTDVNGAKVELLKIKAGGQVASHNHSGEEITVVLAGSFSDADGVYRRGDIIFRDREHKHHRPIASQDADCICLTSVAAPIQFTGFFARLLNPLIRRSHYSS